MAKGPHWEATTLKLTAKQARVLWHLVTERAKYLQGEPTAFRCKQCSVTSLNAIARKLVAP